MTSAAIKIFHIALGTVTLAAGLLVSERASITRPDNIISNAAAIIGRPLTPLSYAGVARRTTRRAVAVGAAVGVGATVGAAAAPVVVAPTPTCVQVVDAYGRLYWRCP
jgi:hypothetical protein